MIKLVPLVVFFALFAGTALESSALAAGLSVEPIVFAARDGTKVDAERGSFEVPENRADPASRKIKISFVRFRSTSRTPGDPIVYLAGGPGGSGPGTAEGLRFPLFMKLREVGDVIALDVAGRKLTLRVDDEEIGRRRAAWTAPPPRFARGWGLMFSRHITQADRGCDFDFLEGTAAVPEPEIH
jgi:hypothetical protein